MRLHFHGGPEDGRVEASSFIDNPNPVRTFRRGDTESGREVVYVNRYALVATYTEPESDEAVGHYEWTDEKVEVLV